MTDLNIQVLLESFVEYAEKYIEQIEKMKTKKVKDKQIYEFKQGTLIGHPNIRNIFSLTSISKLIYR